MSRGASGIPKEFKKGTARELIDLSGINLLSIPTFSAYRTCERYHAMETYPSPLFSGILQFRDFPETEFWDFPETEFREFPEK